MRKWILWIAALSLASISAASAQVYLSKSVRLVVPLKVIKDAKIEAQ